MENLTALPDVPLPAPLRSRSGRGRAVGMIHVHCTTALLNHNCTKAMNVPIPTNECNKMMEAWITDAERVLGDILVKNPLLRQATAQSPCRSLVFLVDFLWPENSSRSLLDDLHNKLSQQPWLKYLINRAVAEANTLLENGIDDLEVENVAAPYFVGPAAIPWEELLAVYLCARAVRKVVDEFRAKRAEDGGNQPGLGVHILSCDELETLPIALASGAFFIRSEATLFQGMRPEGAVQNNGNLARFLYVRRLLRQKCQSKESDLQLPLIWSDVHKKHTHFTGDLDDMGPWFDNIGFCHLEGVIVTGDHTGSDVNIQDLKRAREAIDKHKNFLATRVVGSNNPKVESLDQLIGEKLPLLPLVTGSGTKLEEYQITGADFIICGSLLKKGSYWENEVDPSNVQKVVQRVRGQ